MLVSDDLSIISFEMLGRDCKKIELYTERQEGLVTCTPHLYPESFAHPLYERTAATGANAQLHISIITLGPPYSFAAEAGLALSRPEALGHLFQRHRRLLISPQRLNEVAVAAAIWRSHLRS